MESDNSVITALLDFMKTLFQIHWALGLFVGLILLSLVIYAFVFALIAALIFGAVYFFQQGNYVAGGALTAVTVLLFVYGYVSNRKESAPSPRRGGDEEKRAPRRRKKALDEESSKQSAISSLVLSVAKENQGRVTLAEVASHDGITLDQASTELDRLAVKGACRSLLSDSGVVVYHFPEFEDAGIKKNIIS